jgi:hypothetical protein
MKIVKEKKVKQEKDLCSYPTFDIKTPARNLKFM